MLAGDEEEVLLLCKMVMLEGNVKCFRDGWEGVGNDGILYLKKTNVVEQGRSDW